MVVFLQIFVCLFRIQELQYETFVRLGRKIIDILVVNPSILRSSS